MFIRSIHRVDKGRWYATFRRIAAVVVVRQPCEEQTFDEGSELCCNLEEIHWRGKHDSVGIGRLAKRFGEVILASADIKILRVLQLARQTRHTAFAVHVIDMYCLYLDFITYRLRSLSECLNHCSRVHVLTRAAVDNHYLLHNGIVFIRYKCTHYLGKQAKKRCKGVKRIYV